MPKLKHSSASHHASQAKDANRIKEKIPIIDFKNKSKTLLLAKKLDCIP